MSEQTATAETTDATTTDATAETTDGTQETQQTQQTTEAEGLPDSIKAILEKERKAARDADRRAKAAEKKAQEYEDRDKSDLEKATARAERAERERDEERARGIRTQVALEKRVPADLMEFLSGSDRAEIEKKADALMAHLKPTTATNFDSGAREAVDEKKTPEQQHQETIIGLLTRGRAPAT